MAAIRYHCLCWDFLSYFIVRRLGSPVMKRLTSIIPALLLGVCIALLLSVAETHIAQALGRLPMAAELPWRALCHFCAGL